MPRWFTRRRVRDRGRGAFTDRGYGYSPRGRTLGFPGGPPRCTLRVPAAGQRPDRLGLRGGRVRPGVLVPDRTGDRIAAGTAHRGGPPGTRDLEVRRRGRVRGAALRLDPAARDVARGDGLTGRAAGALDHPGV